MFGVGNFVCHHHLQEDQRLSSPNLLATVYDYIVWYAKDKTHVEVSTSSIDEKS